MELTKDFVGLLGVAAAPIGDHLEQSCYETLESTGFLQEYSRATV